MSNKIKVHGTSGALVSNEFSCKQLSGDHAAELRNGVCYGKSDSYAESALWDWDGTDFIANPSGKAWKDFYYGKLWLGTCYASDGRWVANWKDVDGNYYLTNKIDCEANGYEWYQKCKWQNGQLYCVGPEWQSENFNWQSGAPHGEIPTGFLNEDWAIPFTEYFGGVTHFPHPQRPGELNELYTTNNEHVHLHYGDYELEFISNTYGNVHDWGGITLSTVELNVNRSKDPADWYQYNCEYDRRESSLMSCFSNNPSPFHESSDSINHRYHCFADIWEIDLQTQDASPFNNLSYPVPNGVYSLFNNVTLPTPQYDNGNGTGGGGYDPIRIRGSEFGKDIPHGPEGGMS
jgi:hypothetical protein